MSSQNSTQNIPQQQKINLAALFDSEIVIVNRKINEMKNSIQTMIQLHDAMLQELAKNLKPKLDAPKPEKKVKKRGK